MDNVFLKYFETQPRATMKQMWWHDTLALMDIELICKLGNDNVVLDVLNYREEYQGEMPWERIKILRTMFVVENDLEKKIWEVYAKDCLT